MPNSVRIAKRRDASRRDIVDAAWSVAHRSGLGALTLREVAAEVGMRAPSLYSHFPSKEAIYDAMFADAWTTFLAYMQDSDSRLPTAPRARLRAMARAYVEFACADLARHQIMDVRTLPEFEPSPASYAVSARCYRLMTAELGTIAVTRSAAIDMYTALLAGIIEQQLANDPGGRRWIKLVPRMVDMYADALGIPKAASTRRRAR